MKPRLKLALIYGSTREGRLADTIGPWLLSRIAAGDDFEVSLIDPRELPAGHEQKETLALAQIRQRIARADAFMVLTPEYNHGYPAALKALLDAVYNEWQAKPVAFVSYGGVSGGLRAVEQLRQVFAELHAVTTRDVLAFVNVWEQFGADGRLKAPEPAEKRLRRVLAQLRWWALALREARHVLPYGEVAA